MHNKLAINNLGVSENSEELAEILAKGVIRYLRIQQAVSISDSNYADNESLIVMITSTPKSSRAGKHSLDSASKKDLPVVSAHGSLSHELTDTEPEKEDKTCR